MESKRIVFKRLYPVNYKTTEPLFYNTGLMLVIPIDHPQFKIGGDGWMEVYEGYTFDGASGGIDSECFMRGACGHDVIYQSHQLGFDLPKDWKEKADRMLIRLCREDGMSWIRSQWVYQAVKLFGRGRARDLNKYDETLISP